MTKKKSSQVRVNRKRQITIPLELISRLGIEEGALLEIMRRRHNRAKAHAQIEGGKAVREEGTQKNH